MGSPAVAVADNELLNNVIFSRKSRVPVDESCIVLEPGFKRISETGIVDDDGVINLAGAVLRQACFDLKYSCSWLRKHPFDHTQQRKDVEKLKKETEWFFRSRWFSMIVDYDGNKLINMLRRA